MEKTEHGDRCTILCMLDDDHDGSCVAESTVDYTCECDATERAVYRVTHHDGTTSVCAYCAPCAAHAAIDWNGETAKIEALDR